MRKLILLLLVPGTMLALAACGQSSKRSPGTASPEGAAVDTGSTVSPETLEALAGYYHLPFVFDDPVINALPVEERPVSGFLKVERQQLSMLIRCRLENGELVKVGASVPAKVTDDSIQTLDAAHDGDAACNAAVSKGTFDYSLDGTGLTLSVAGTADAVEYQKVDSTDYARLGLE